MKIVFKQKNKHAIKIMIANGCKKIAAKEQKLQGDNPKIIFIFNNFLKKNKNNIEKRIVQSKLCFLRVRN